MVIFGQHFDPYWVEWAIGTFIGLRIIGKLLKALWMYHFGRTMIDYNNPFGQSELRVDRRVTSFWGFVSRGRGLWAKGRKKDL